MEYSAAIVVWATSLVLARSTTMRSQTSLDVGSFKVSVFNFNQGGCQGGPVPFQFFETTNRSAFSTNAQLRFTWVTGYSNIRLGENSQYTLHPF